MIDAPGPELFLIAHKVRGEAAFDIAIQLEGYPGGPDEICWISPTFGYRAKPYWWVPLRECLGPELDGVPPAPADWPDLFAINDPSPARPARRSPPSATLDDLA